MNPLEFHMRMEHQALSRSLRVPPDEVLVFKTSVKSPAQVDALRPLLDLTIAGAGQWNFDLDDRDRILRVESVTRVRERVVALLTGMGFACSELE